MLFERAATLAAVVAPIELLIRQCRPELWQEQREKLKYHILSKAVELINKHSLCCGIDSQSSEVYGLGSYIMELFYEAGTAYGRYNPEESEFIILNEQQLMQLVQNILNF
jgi:hypothetical protein